MAQSEILFEQRGRAGLVTLNRPHALNAVTHGMVRLLGTQLAAWARDPAITRVIVMGAGERAFSAGGDIRAVYELGRAGREREALMFWREEYALNAMIKHYPKPYVSLIDGIVMGGGVGISVHGSHRIAGNRFVFAMPEVGIGFFPDVGATWFMPRLPGETGTYCALTGARLKTPDAVAAGIATCHVPSAKFADLCVALGGREPIETVLAAFARPAGEVSLLKHQAAIDRFFAAGEIEAILAALDAEAASGRDDADWARATASTIRSKSPTSLKLALMQMRRGRDLTFEQCMQAEFRIVSRIVHEHDFYEGIRAAIIDKDNAPRWHPDTLAELSKADIEGYFAPIENELELP